MTLRSCGTSAGFASRATFFFRAMGATDMEIGWFGTLTTFAQFLLAPGYGWLVDRRSVYWPVLFSKAACGFGSVARYSSCRSPRMSIMACSSMVS